MQELFFQKLGYFIFFFFFSGVKYKAGENRLNCNEQFIH